ncbi:type III secretion protein R [Halodesulfovibrio marinisediminis DSM 17456]|uniref:Type III secretion protein R n=2 Tax=Halodesulfovibrio marinisediminis TaxID=458711 RepID=A0A1N6I8X7_9BACT|nr:type III secretion system export apparatus subunit SctR [Halodesulfovibrio marinisediminis]SIO28415.1 type III secretion protein R [Halodesulfovibrio marinisediminis DSM 17456]
MGIQAIQMLPLIIILGLAPFAIMMGSTYVRIVIVFSLVRNALGIQQIPPGMVVNGLAVILSVFIMAPVGNSCLTLLEQQQFPSDMRIQDYLEVGKKVTPPFVEFLDKNSSPLIKAKLVATAKQIWPKKMFQSLQKDSLFIVLPAFTLSELTKAFQIGFLLYLPFVAIDLIISNILLAMGMMMVSPTTISLPFKLLLFVVLDGWVKISQGLMLGYL